MMKESRLECISQHYSVDFSVTALCNTTRALVTLYLLQVNPNETARHMYYVGRIRVVQLEYSEAFTCLMQV